MRGRPGARAGGRRGRAAVALAAAVALVVVVVADPAALSVSALVLDALAALAVFVLLWAVFGIVAGLSCLAQLAFVVWAIGLSCTLRTAADPESRLWGTVAVGAFGSSLVASRLLRRRARRSFRGEQGSMPRVIDTHAVEHDGADRGRAP